MPKSKKSVHVNGQGTVGCQNCTVALGLVDQVKALFEDERSARMDSEERHRSERDALLQRIQELTRFAPSAPTNRIAQRLADDGLPPIPLAASPVSSQPADLAAKIAAARFNGRFPAPVPIAVHGRAPAEPVLPPDPIAEEQADADAAAAVTGAATQRE